MSRLSVPALQLLRELQRHGTLTAAAQAMGINRSAASHRLAALEQKAGITLIEKSGRTIRLTEAGKLMAHHAERVLHELDQAAELGKRMTETG